MENKPSAQTSAIIDVEEVEECKKKRHSEQKNNESSLSEKSDVNSSITLTPSILKGSKKDSGTDTSNSNSIISEQIISDVDSVENDRSFQEIEVINVPNIMLQDQNISYENPDKCLIEPFIENINKQFDDVQESVNGSEYSFIKCIIYEILQSDKFEGDRDDCTQSKNSSISSFDLFDNINLNDSLVEKQSTVNADNCSNKNLKLKADVKGLLLKVKQLEEIVTIKDTALTVLTSELESLREAQSSNSSTLNSGTSTEYKQVHEELQNKVVEYQNALAYRDNIIQQLTESLQESINRKEELEIESVKFLKEIDILKKHLIEASDLISNKGSNDNILIDNAAQTEADKFDQTDDLCHLLNEIESQLNTSQLILFRNLKAKLSKYIEENVSRNKEIKILEDELSSEKQGHEKLEITDLKKMVAHVGSESTEIERLRRELEVKHASEMEELRTYFEQKCADMEKNYTEDVLSSRKLSSSSSCSVNDLNSDVYEMGPGGDVPLLTSLVEIGGKNATNITRNDLERLKEDLEKIVEEIDSVDSSKITKKDLSSLLKTLSQCDLKLLSKLNHQQHQEDVETLRGEYESKIESLNAEHEKKLKELKATVQQQAVVQEIASLGDDYELDEVVQSYERRLQEQVMLAKIDIINALEYQIQMLVKNSDEDDAEWPSELLQLRDKFTEKYEKKISEMSEAHAEEIAKLKEEHLRNLNRTIKRRSLKDGSSTQEELDIINERDNLRKCTSVLRLVVTNLLKYFYKCEEELNNTLVEEILKQNESTDCVASAVSFSKRVHIAPGNVTEILGAMNDSLSLIDLDMSDLENELKDCLEKLKDEANDILAMSAEVQTQTARDGGNEDDDDNVVDRRISILTRQVFLEKKEKNDLLEKLEESEKLVKELEREKADLEEKQRILSSDLISKEKITRMVQHETVSEGYGEKDNCLVSNFGEEVVSFNVLQEKARNLLTEKLPDEQAMIQLIEDLCRAGDKLRTQGQKEHLDLKQQIEAADKKIRATVQFLEEQATERELERDEAVKEINRLKEMLREREKDRTSCERIGREEEVCKSLTACPRNCTDRIIMHTVEQLEHQMREMSKLMEENESRTREIELEKQEATDKVQVLREIVRDLETQVETKTESEEELKQLVQQLQLIVKQQNKSNEDLHQQLDSIQDVERIQEHVDRLENELQNLRLNAELIGKEGLLQQINEELNDLEGNIEKRTHDLEALHTAISATNCSSPSEDMSIRDQIRPRAPSVALRECHVPLQQLARLKEKLLIHSRAEDAAIKRIRDLEMQLEHVKHDLDESQNEKDILQDQVSEQLVLISSLQMRLDEQRLRAEQAQKQNNTSLEVRIYDLENEIQTLKDTVQKRDKTIKHLSVGIEQTKQRLEDREKELLAKMEDTTFVEQQKQIEQLHEENEMLKERISCDAKNAQILPSLVDNIIADKNRDIEMLREKLNDTQRELESFLSLNFDKDQLRSLSSLKSSEERALGDLLSLVINNSSSSSNRAEPENVRKEVAERTIENLDDPSKPNFFKRNVNETTMFLTGDYSRPKISEFEVEVSEIEKIGKPNGNYSNEEVMLLPPSSTPHLVATKSSEKKRVHFEGVAESEELLKTKINNLEENLKELEIKLESTEKLLRDATDDFETEKKRLKGIENDLRLEINETNKRMAEKDEKILALSEDSARKDEMYFSLAKEKRDLTKRLEDMERNESGRYRDLSEALEAKDKQLSRLESELKEMQRTVETLQKEKDNLKTFYENQLSVLEHKTKELDETKERVSKTNDLNEKLKKDLQNKEEQVERMRADLAESRNVIEEKDNQLREIRERIIDEQKSLNSVEEKLKELQTLLLERETEIDNLNYDIGRYQEENAYLKNKKVKSMITDDDGVGGGGGTKDLQSLKLCKELAEKDLTIVKCNAEIDDLKYEVNHLQHLLQEKEKIIDQISEDSKSLHVNLETIQNKMRENGNVLDLKKRLHEEQVINAALRQQLESFLRTSPSGGKNNNIDGEEVVNMAASIEEITGQVQKQLNYSAMLDSNIISALKVDVDDVDDVNHLKDLLARQKIVNKKLQEAQDVMRRQHSTLEQRYENVKQEMAKVEGLLDKEKRNFHCMQLENAGILEQMRVQLEAAMENEMEFEKLLKLEKIKHRDTENQLVALRARMATAAALNNNSDNSKTELTEYKSLPTVESPEIMILRNNLEVVQEENQKLKSELKASKKAKGELNANLKYVKEILQFKSDEIVKLEEKYKRIEGEYEKLNGKLIQTKVDLEQRIGEVENSRLLINELEEDGRSLRRQVEELQKRLFIAEDNKTNIIVPEKFLKKINELKHLVKEQMRDNKLMSETLAKLTEERQILQLRVNELEATTDMPFADIAARANHLFARYLKCESNRKALVWQKRYLTSLLATYQDFHLPVAAKLSPTTKNQSIKGIRRFKTVAISIIVIVRMQYLVKRWQSGKRFGAHAHLPPSSRKYDLDALNQVPACFRVGEPVSNNRFLRPNIDLKLSVTSTGNTHVDPWSGASPPTRQYRGGEVNVNGTQKTHELNKNVNDCGNFVSLTSPQLLSEYLERFDQIQQRLGIAVKENAT